MFVLWKRAHAQVRPVLRTMDVVSVRSGVFHVTRRPREEGWAILKGVAGTPAALLDKGLSFSCGHCAEVKVSLLLKDRVRALSQVSGTITQCRLHVQIGIDGL